MKNRPLRELCLCQVDAGRESAAVTANRAAGHQVCRLLLVPTGWVEGKRRPRRVLELWIYYNTELVMICGATGCRRRAKLDLIGMVDRYGAAATLGDLQRRLCCAICGAKLAEPFFVIESSRRFSDQWFPHPP
jgi:hypothetical protein